MLQRVVDAPQVRVGAVDHGRPGAAPHVVVEAQVAAVAGAAVVGPLEVAAALGPAGDGRGVVGRAVVGV